MPIQNQNIILGLGLRIGLILGLGLRIGLILYLGLGTGIGLSGLSRGAVRGFGAMKIITRTNVCLGMKTILRTNVTEAVVYLSFSRSVAWWSLSWNGSWARSRSWVGGYIGSWVWQEP